MIGYLNRIRRLEKKKHQESELAAIPLTSLVPHVVVIRAGTNEVLGAAYFGMVKQSRTNQIGPCCVMVVTDFGNDGEWERAAIAQQIKLTSGEHQSRVRNHGEISSKQPECN